MNVKEVVQVAMALVKISSKEDEKKREEEAKVKAANKRARRARRVSRIKALKSSDHTPGNAGHHCKTCGVRWDQASKECAV